MSRSEDEERTPLVYEDRVGSSNVVEDDGGRRRRRYICIALTTVCLGVGLVLAVALPITMSQGKASSDPVLRLSFEPSSESMTTQEALNWFSDHKTDVSDTDKMHASPSSTVSSDSSSTSPPELPEDSSSDTSSTSTVSPASSTVSPSDPFALCKAVPHRRRSAIDLERLNGKLLFELYRIQSRNSPGYATGISCSVMEMNFGTNATASKDGTMKLKWMESGFVSRYPRSVDVNLERSQGSTYDWTETFGNQSSAKGRLSLLVQIDGYLLTYECFPNASYYPSPAYAIHLYSMVPWTGNTYVATSLMTLANIWGLNPAEERLTPISHRFCSLQNVPR